MSGLFKIKINEPNEAHIDDLAAEIWYVYSRLTNQSLISQGGGGGGRGQTDSHANLTNYGGMGRNFLL